MSGMIPVPEQVGMATAVAERSGTGLRSRPSGTLIVCGAGYVSGKEIMALELGQGLSEGGHRVSFVISSWNNGDFPDRLKRAGLPARALPVGFISATLTKECIRMTAEQAIRWPELLFGYARLLTLENPSRVVHTNLHHLLLLAPYLRSERDLAWIHELIPNSPRHHWAFNWLAKRLGAFICVSDAVAGSLRRIGIRREKLHIIHNGLSDPANGQDRETGDGLFRVGIVGQVGAWKGHDDLVDGFALVYQRYPRSELHIFGTGDPGYVNGLKQKCNDLGIADSVHWHGFVADRHGIYPALDACVVPSRTHDPLPTTALEAGFFGLPVVATRRGGLTEIIEHERNGLLVEVAQPDAIAGALCRLIEQSALRSQLGGNARRMALERFGRERFVSDFIELLEPARVE